MRRAQTQLWSNSPHPGALLEIYALDAGGGLVGGLIGETNAIPEWLEISILWVAEEGRRQGIGRQLMGLAEEEAKKRGCRYARLATSDYQAPEFYLKTGYVAGSPGPDGRIYRPASLPLWVGFNVLPAAKTRITKYLPTRGNDARIKIGLSK